MVFASVTFVLFFVPLVFAGYFLIPIRLRNYWIIASSIVFYLWGGGIHDLLILLAVATADFFMAKAIAKSSKPKFWLVVSIIWNLGLLAYFKYAGFLLNNAHGATAQLIPSLAWVFSFQHAWTKVALPLGISFFIFETLSYVTDVYRGVQKPARKLSDYAMYLTLFPHLVAGPIYRFGDIEADLDPEIRARKINSRTVLTGIFLFSFGLAKKCLVANPLAQVADNAFAHGLLSPFEAWLGILSYTFQIYFDFSGYSTMAIGLAQIFGFTFPQNFNQPYCARSITDFWRRWHMSLSHWFKDYLYIPLSGNQNGAMRTYRNLFVVFFLCGLWHGASWTFVIWGVYHGSFLILERRGISPLNLKLPRALSQLLCFLTVVLGWVFFRADSLSLALGYFKALFGLETITFTRPYFVLLGDLATGQFRLVFALGLLSLVSFKKVYEKLAAPEQLCVTKSLASFILLWLCLQELASNTFNPFIYYRF